MFVGDRGKILGDRILPSSRRDSYKAPEPYIPSSPGHEQEWINACKGGDPGGSDFEWAGPLTETVLLGNIAIRKELKEILSGELLKFDPERFCFPELPEADKFLHMEYREGWTL